MKVLLTGSNVYYGLTMSYQRAFKENNWEVIIFADEELYKEKIRFFKNKYLKKILHRLFWRLFCISINKKIIETIEKEKPDLIFILKGWYFSPKTLLEIKKKYPMTTLFCFNPDNPFNNWHHGNSNSWIRKSIPLYDCYFIWGKFLIEPLKMVGAQRVEYLPFAYDQKLHYPINVTEEERKFFGSDVAFIGSWDEEREWWSNHLLDYDLKIWGNAWQKANRKLQDKWQKREVIDEDFSKVCNSSKIILNFIRKQNGSAHNMRTFEVPACGGFMLSTRTEEQRGFFEEGKEADYFSTPEELKQKIDFYLKNEESREKIAKAGYRKLINSDYSYNDTVKRILEIYRIIKK